MPFLCQHFRKISLPWDNQPPTPSPTRSLRSLALAPPVENPIYASVESDPALRCLHVPVRGSKQKYATLEILPLQNSKCSGAPAVHDGKLSEMAEFAAMMHAILDWQM